MTVLQYIASIALLGLGGLLASFNGWVLFRQLRGKPSPSAAPLIGGVFLFVGARLFPGGLLRPWAVIGLFLDYGFLPYMILFSISMAQESRRYAEKNRILSLDFEAAACTGAIYVYPDDECIYKWAARDGHSSGSIVMKVDEYTPNETLKLSIQKTAIRLGVHDGSWQLDSEEGWHNSMHSLVDSTITPSAANKSLERKR
jgi:hypothetical protein